MAEQPAPLPVVASPDARRTAVDALGRIERGAYANLVVPSMLDRSPLSTRDRAFVTKLVYGTTRMRRACDWAVDRFLTREPPAEARALLRLGAYQLVFMGTPPHAAVSSTVAVAPVGLRGLVNAVLRRVGDARPVEWPDDATRLSYPDWIVDRLTLDLGRDDALAALEQMNTSGEVHERDDGYIQDRASEDVARYVGAAAGERVLDACAAPGGKATLMAAAVTGGPRADEPDDERAGDRGGGLVAAVDLHPARARVMASNAARLDAHAVATVVADSRVPPWRPATFDRVLVDAPCSGLGVLRRRPDARWRIGPDDVDNLAGLQRELVAASIPLLRPGGVFVYAACTLTLAETVALDELLERTHPGLTADAPPPGPWTPLGRGARILPQDAGTDGMYLLRLRSTDR